MGTQIPVEAMLIVCPNCATSYMIDSASLGRGRTVRCARCKTTWFADGSDTAPEMTTAVDDTAAEGEAQPFRGTLKPDDVASGAEVAASGTESTSTVASAVQSPATSAPVETPEQPPVAIADAPSLVPPAEPPPLPDAAAAGLDSNEIENFAVRRKRLQARRKKARRSSRWTALILVLFAFNVALIGARSEVVRFLPQTASLFSAIGMPVNLRNLKFENMRISKETQEGLSSLIIEGTIVSITSKPTEVPRLRFAARDATGQEIYTWTALPSRSILGPGEKLDFRSRLVSPPPSANDVIVRFFNAQDVTTPGAK